MVLALLAAAAAVGLIWLAPLESAARRRAWRYFGLGLVLFAIAGVWFRVVYSHRDVVPVPNPTDALFLAGYASVVLAVILLFRRPGDEAPRSAVLDGLLLGLAATTTAEAAILHPMAWSAGDVDQVTRATALLYPVFSLSLLGTVLARGGLDVLRSPRLQALATGAALFAMADLAYVRRVAEEDLSPGAWYHSLYLLATLAFAAAGWLRAPAPRQRLVEGVRMVVLPGGVAAVAAGVLVWDHYQPRSDLAVILATLTLGTVALRAGTTVHYLRQLLDMRRLALTDDLTGLPNRRWFIGRLADTVTQTPPEGFTVLLFGIDRFKDLNDTLGHAVGDQVLRDGAARLASVLGPGDLVARIGGDEFAVLSAGGDDSADRLVAAVRSAFAAPFPLADLDLPVDMSIGGVSWPGGGETAETLLRRADVALADAKRSRQGFARYQPARDPYSRERLALAVEMRPAIGAGALTVVYQPILDVRSWTISGAEALVRWDHPTFGRMQPDEFLSIAQQTGSMRAITGFVLDTALQQCKQWRDQAVDLAIAVNLAPSSLLDARLPAAVDAALCRAGVPPTSLVLEIVEDGLLEDPTGALAILRSLHDMGVRLAIDDYGTGYASLGYLKDLPVQSLKIDRSFVAGLGDREPPESAARNAAIVGSTIVLAHELGLSVVAEGVEDARTLLRLERKGVDAVQGFFVSEPLPGGDIPTVSASWTAERRGRSAVP